MWELAAATVGSSLISGLMGQEAAEGGAAATRDAANQSTALSREQFGTMRKDLAPFRGAGATALERLMYLSGLGRGPAKGTYKHIYVTPEQARAATGIADRDDRFESDYAGFSNTPGEGLTQVSVRTGDMVAQPDDEHAGSLIKDFEAKPFDYSLVDFYKDPSYQFRLEEGEKALTRGASARGMVKSTPGLKSLMRFSSDLAGTEYGAAFGRAVGVDNMNFTRAFGVDSANKDRTQNLLMSMAGMGQNAAATTGAAGMNMASNAGAALIAGGQATAAGITGAASSWNNAVQGGMGNIMYQKRFDEMMKRMPVFSGFGGSSPY